jgi:hypothetical protein
MIGNDDKQRHAHRFASKAKRGQLGSVIGLTGDGRRVMLTGATGSPRRQSAPTKAARLD